MLSRPVPSCLRAFPWILLSLLGAVSLCGCGAGSGAQSAGGPGPGASQVDATRGALHFSLVFPTVKRSASPAAQRTRGIAPGNGYDGRIPLGSHSVKITLTNPTTGAAISPERVVDDSTRPNGVSGTIIVGFPLLPVGPVKIDVTAYPAVGATGTPLATGTESATIVANATTGANVLMALTIKSFTVTPPVQTLQARQPPFQSGMVNAQALDAQGRPLLYPIEYFSDNPTILDITAISADFMHATITPLQNPEVPVTVNVTAVEPNSGMTGTVQVIVTP